MASIVSSPTGAAESRSLPDGAAALLATLLMLGFYATQSFSTLSQFGGDNDSLMRLVQVRDLLAGQNWFDLTQHRMGPDGGIVMHWSRLVDAPIAGLILAGTALTGSRAAGEAFALVAWPALLFAASLWLLLILARRLGGAWAMLPALVIGGAALHFLGIFAPGAIDHHNLQLTLTLAAAAGLLAGGSGAAAAGASSALMLAVGMEAAPYVAAAGAVAAGLFQVGGEAGRGAARGFGASFAVTAGLSLAATIAPDAWTRAVCDAYSGGQFAIAAVAGGGLAAVAASRGLSATPARRLLALTVLGALVAGLVFALMPHCLAAPYAGLDPRLHAYWIDHIAEAQSLPDILRSEPLTAAAHYATPFVAMLVLLAGARREGARRETIVIGLFLFVAIAVSIWQVRGAKFSIPLAVAPLAAWVGVWRARAVSEGRRATFGMVAAWLLSVNALWTLAAAALGNAAASDGSNATALGECHAAGDYAGLAALPPRRVLSISNLGSPILRFTGHSALAGPYHRNAAGNLAALDALMGDAVTAREVLRAHRIDLIVLCPGNPESPHLARLAPEGLLARLLEGRTPVWLEPLPADEDAALRLYRVER